MGRIFFGQVGEEAGRGRLEGEAEERRCLETLGLGLGAEARVKWSKWAHADEIKVQRKYPSTACLVRIMSLTLGSSCAILPKMSRY